MRCLRGYPFGFESGLVSLASSRAEKLGWKWPVILTVFLLFVVHELISLGGNSKGTKYAATSKETIYYSGDSTMQDAQALGEEFKKIGYFTDTTGKDVLLHRDQSGTVISFVMIGSA
jgi:hypothetical protein